MMTYKRYIVFLWYECENPSPMPNADDSFDNADEAALFIKRNIAHHSIDYASVFDCSARAVILNFGYDDEPYDELTGANYTKVER